MEIAKATDEDKEYFRSLVPDDDRVEVRQMFGNLGAFVNGNMFMALFGASVGLRLADGDRRRLLGEAGSGPFGPAERPMGAYASLPSAWRSSTSSSAPWVALAFDQAATLPRKTKASSREH